MSSSFVLVSEYSSGFNNIVSSNLPPWDLLRIPNESSQMLNKILNRGVFNFENIEKIRHMVKQISK